MKASRGNIDLEQVRSICISMAVDYKIQEIETHASRAAFKFSRHA